MAIQSSDYFVVTSTNGSDTRKVAAADLFSAASGWYAIVNSGSTSYKVLVSNLADIASDSRYMIVNRGSTSYKVSTAEVVNTAGIPSTAAGEEIFKSSGKWTCPTGVYSVCVVCIGAGANGANAGGGGSQNSGGGGALVWANNIPVIPGEKYKITCGANSNSLFRRDGSTNNGGWDTSESLSAGGAASYVGGTWNAVRSGVNGQYILGSYGGGNGGNGGTGQYPGGGGAGGYAGNGGNGANGNNDKDHKGYDGAGGGGGGGQGWFPCGGGGVSMYGQGSNGAGGGQNYNSATNTGADAGGGGGSGGQYGTASKKNITGNNNSTSGGGYYGGGGGRSGRSGAANMTGAQGIVRIIWGNGRYFPSTNVGPTAGYTPANNIPWTGTP